MTRPKIKTALIAIFIVIAVIVGGFASFAVSRMSTINDNVSDLATNWVPSVVSAEEMTANLWGLRVAYRDHVLAVDEKGKADAEKSISDTKDRFTKQLGIYDGLSSSTVDRGMVQSIRSDMADYFKAGDAVMALSHAKKDDDAKAAVRDQLNPIGKRISGTIASLVQFNVDGSKASYAASQEVFAATMTMTFVVIGALAVVILGSIFFCLLGHRPADPADHRRDDASGRRRYRKCGSLCRPRRRKSVKWPVPSRSSARPPSPTSASNSRRKPIAHRPRPIVFRLTAEAEAAAQKRLQEATSGLATGLRRLAGGDLSFELTEPFAPDFEALRHDLNAAVGQLGETLRSVAQSTVSLDSGTREIGQSADDLSKRTEQQAASLEETAAALDEITANVSNLFEACR